MAFWLFIIIFFSSLYAKNILVGTLLLFYYALTKWYVTEFIIMLNFLYFYAHTSNVTNMTKAYLCYLMIAFQS